ncbi:hypothetical protein [Kurthia sibirica]|uniref:hypothetical protein n=1 Tax=Kurthia sibirica TaxID=202750 RepID=UPI0011B1CAFF|nr:hypothetical protein [Kurthia sibirica]
MIKDKQLILIEVPTVKKQYFTIFWMPQSISMVGSQITVIGLPWTATYYLNANSTQMAFL